MKKRTIIIILVMIAVLIATGVIWLVLNSSGNIQVSVAAPDNKSTSSGYIYQISFGGMPNISGKKGKQIEMINNDLNEFYDEFRKSYDKPYYVEAKYENLDGKTIITFKGEVTEKGADKLTDFEKVFSYDFIVTETINTSENDVLNYFN